MNDVINYIHSSLQENGIFIIRLKKVDNNLRYSKVINGNLIPGGTVSINTFDLKSIYDTIAFHYGISKDGWYHKFSNYSSLSTSLNAYNKIIYLILESNDVFDDEWFMGKSLSNLSKFNKEKSLLIKKA